MTMRSSFRWALALLSLLAGAASAQIQPQAVLIENFEAGVGSWKTNDGLATASRPPSIASIYAVSPGAPRVGGGQAGLIEFDAAQKTWASVTLTVDGGAWADSGCTGISLWLRGDGSRQKIGVVLRSYTKAAAVTVDTSYSREIALTSTEWLNLRLPFASFRDDRSRPPDEAHLRGVKLFQFVKTGSWPAVRLGVDEIRAEVFPATKPEQPPAGVLLLDFDAGGRKALLQQGVCLGSDVKRLLADQAFAAKVRSSLALLPRPLLRVKLSDFYERDVRQVNTANLQRTLAWIRSCGGDPLLCLDQPLPAAGVRPAQGWRDFGALCAYQASLLRQEPGPHTYEIGDEPILSGQFKSIEAATATYNAIAAQILLADPAAVVGGMGFASAWDEHLSYFVEHARTLRFLSFHFYGAHNPVAEDGTVFNVACTGRAEDLPHQLSLAEIRELLTRARGPEAQLWITECALNSARQPDGRARDPRLQSHFGAAWMAALSLTMAPIVDRVLWFKAFGHGWGLLTDEGSATPAFQAVSLLTRFLPTGATVGDPLQASRALVAPVATSGGRQVLVVNGAASGSLDLELRGTPPVQPARIRRLDPTVPAPVFEPLAPSPRQHLTLTGPGIAIIEAPNAR